MFWTEAGREYVAEVFGGVYASGKVEDCSVLFSETGGRGALEFVEVRSPGGTTMGGACA